MSAYLTLATPMTDRGCLLAALTELGFGAEKVEVHEAPVALAGYRGDARSQKAHLVIRRQHVGASSNDIGFEATPTGYRVHVSDYDRRRYGPQWMARLDAAYQRHDAARRARLAEEERRRLEAERRALVEAQRQAIRARARKLGYRVDERREQGAVRLVLVRRSY